MLELWPRRYGRQGHRVGCIADGQHGSCSLIDARQGVFRETSRERNFSMFVSPITVQTLLATFAHYLVRYYAGRARFGHILEFAPVAIQHLWRGQRHGMHGRGLDRLTVLT